MFKGVLAFHILTEFVNLANHPNIHNNVQCAAQIVKNGVPLHFAYYTFCPPYIMPTYILPTIHFEILVVLDIYRTNMFHLTSTGCALVLQKDMEYWGIDELMMEPCCALKYYPEIETCVNEKQVSSRKS